MIFIHFGFWLLAALIFNIGIQYIWVPVLTEKDAAFKDLFNHIKCKQHDVVLMERISTMGHPESIFVSTLDESSSFFCAVCLDVLEDASSYRTCGHTFCDGCISECLAANPTCPTCRKPVHTGCNPNYSLRDIIDKLEVKCLESDRPPLRRLTSSDGGHSG